MMVHRCSFLDSSGPSPNHPSYQDTGICIDLLHDHAGCVGHAEMSQELNQRCPCFSRPDNLVKDKDTYSTHIGNERRKNFFSLSSFLKVHSVHLIGNFPFQKEISQKHRNVKVIVFHVTLSHNMGFAHGLYS